MSFVVVIPARFASTRLPGKPLLDIAGKPMIEHVWQRALQSGASEVVIATDDARIAEVAQKFGASVAMTRSEHPSGTDRLQEVAKQRGWSDEQVVVNVQGDEPLIPPSVIDQVAELLLAHSQADIATLCEAITDEAQFRDPNAVKVVCNAAMQALYFSRAPMPWPREGQPLTQINNKAVWGYRHIGLYAYRTHFLHRYVNWDSCLLENTEKLEQLRALYQGSLIQVAESCVSIPSGVDTQHDLDVVRKHLLAQR